MQFGGFLHPGPVPLGHDVGQGVLDPLQHGAVDVIAFGVGVDQLAVAADHAADHGHRVLPPLDLDGGQAQVEVSLEFVPQDGKGDIGGGLDPLVQDLDLVVTQAPAAQHLEALLIGEQTDPETTAAAVRPALVFHDFVAVLVVVNLAHVTVGNEFVEEAVAHAADAAVAVDQDLGGQPQGVGLGLEAGQLRRGVDFGGGDELGGPVGFIPGHVLFGLDVAANAGVDDQLRDASVDLLDQGGGFDNHPFDAEVGVLLHFAEHQGKFVGENLGIQGHPNLSLAAAGQPDSLANLAVFHLPCTLRRAKALGPDIHCIGAAVKDGFHHLQAAAWG